MESSCNLSVLNLDAAELLPGAVRLLVKNCQLLTCYNSGYLEGDGDTLCRNLVIRDIGKGYFHNLEYIGRRTDK